jgi:hypothetical protein
VEQDLVHSAAEARDVIETYRHSGIEISGWNDLLQEAAESFARLSGQRPVAGESVDLIKLARTLSAAASARLQLDQETLDRLSRDLHSIVATTRVPGIPRPEDEDWSF